MINHHLMVAISLISAVKTHLNPKGPTHENYAINCLEEIATKQFKYTNALDVQNIDNVEFLLLTIMTTFNMTSPSHEIQQNLIKRLNILLRFNIEVIDDHRVEFNNRDDCHGQFLDKLKTSFYLLVVDCIESFDNKLQILLELNNYNSRALFLVYYSNSESNFEEKASIILKKLWAKSIINAVVLIPKTLKHLVLYAIKFSFQPYHHCLDSAILVTLDNCKNGVINSNKKYYEDKLGRNHNNCTIDVVANTIEPFVINKSEGFEIVFIKQVGEILNIYFNVTLTGEDSWGVEDEDGFWTNGLGRIQNESCLGVGNFYTTPEYMKDFEFSTPHFVTDLVWIVPIAQYVPKWRVLTIIFSWDLWMVCIGLILVCAVFLRLAALSKDESHFYKVLGNDFLVTFQVIMTCAVFKHPRSDLTRLVFAALAVFSIIISSVYTSSLINFLTHLQRESQIDSIDGVLNKGFHIGGLPVFQNIFNVTDDDKSMRIYEIYQTNESLHVWLTNVANDRDTCTVGSKFFVQYMMAQKDPILTDDKGKSKVYIIKDKIFSYSLSLVTSKGFPFLHKIDHAVELLTTFGIVQEMADGYLHSLKKIEAMNSGSNYVEQLSVDDLQGAFSILILGYLLGFGFVLLENIAAFVKLKMKHKKIKLRKT